MNTEELERAAYMAGDTELARLYGRIDVLQEALGRAVAQLASIDDPDAEALCEALKEI
jgi:hypothetical protein